LHEKLAWAGLDFGGCRRVERERRVRLATRGAHGLPGF
jgi:hypothetical protein